MTTGRLDRAEREILRALDAGPEHAEPHRLLCEFRRVQERWSEAVAACRRATEIAPKRFDLHLELGDLLSERGNGFDDAIRSYRRAVSLDPEDPQPHIRAGGLYERRGRYFDAEAEYREALRLNPNLVRANAGLGSVLFMTDRLPEARRYLLRAIELRPRDMRSHIFLGLSLNHDGQLDLALQELRAAVTIDPHAANAGAGVPEQRERFQNLRAYYLAQLVEDPRDASIWHNVAILSYFVRDYTTAWRHLVRAQHLGYPVDLGFKEVVYARSKRGGGT